MTCLILSEPVRVVGPGKQALGIVEEVTIVAKRDQHLLNRHLEEAGEALVVGLDAGVDDPAMLLFAGPEARSSRAKCGTPRSEPMACDTAAELALELATRLPQGAAGMQAKVLAANGA